MSSESDMRGRRFVLGSVPMAGTVVRELRREAELTQLELAERMGVSRTTVVAWEQGASLTVPRLIEVLRLFGYELQVRGRGDDNV